MSLAEVDWKRYLGPNSLIPADLEIRVLEGEDKNDWLRENVHMAHKSFMASVSDVFAAQFYGKLAQDKTYTYFENTTMVAVGTFLEFIYSKPKEFSLGSLSIDNLFLVLSLADKFNIYTLGAKVRIAIRRFPLEKSNVMEVAAVAEKYLEVFDGFSRRLQKRCAEFLAITLKDFSTYSTFLLNDVEDFDLLKKLLRTEQNKPKEIKIPSHLFSKSRPDWVSQGWVSNCIRISPKEFKDLNEKIVESFRASKTGKRKRS